MLFLRYNTPAMQVLVNSTPFTLPDDATVKDLLHAQELGKAPCAVEVNTALVPKRDHSNHTLSPGDQIEIVTLVGGG